jgi:HK97 family phage major capsid protein
MDLVTLETKQHKLLLDAKAMLDLAQKESRGLTDDETTKYDGVVKELEGIGGQIVKLKGDANLLTRLDDLTSGAVERHVDRRLTRKSLGEQFVESEAMKWLVDTKASRPRTWSTPSVELKEALTEAPTSGGALVVPQYLSTIQALPIGVPTVAQLFAQGQATSSAVVYMRETVFTNAAAPVLEGTAKPESTLRFDAVTEPTHKIAHWLPVSNELLEDASQVRSYIDSRLKLGVLLELDDQILNGSGVAPEMLGLLVRSDLTPPVAAAAGKGLDAIAQQIAAVETASQLPVDGIAMHPSDYVRLALLKDTSGQYLGSGPFATPPRPTLWGREIAFSLKLPPGTALVGAFKSAGQLFQRGGLRVEATNSHADFFVKNLWAVLSELRVSLAVYRSIGFGKVTGLEVAAP